MSNTTLKGITKDRITETRGERDHPALEKPQCSLISYGLSGKFYLNNCIIRKNVKDTWIM